jgi:uncharacterized protein
MSDEPGPLVDNIAAIEGPTCALCEAPLAETDRFCRRCGGRVQLDEEPGIVSRKWDSVRQLLLFFIVEAVICACSDIKAFHSLSGLITFDVMAAVLAIVFVGLNWSSCKALLVWNNFSIGRLLVYCVIAVVAACMVNFTVDWLNERLFAKQMSYYAFFAPHRHAILLTIFFIAITPALFEELAFRAFLLGKLLMVTERNQAAVISGFMFAIMHMSFISLFWLVPFGILLGYIRIRQNTIWYGSCIHFCFNLTACVIEIIQFGRTHG